MSVKILCLHGMGVNSEVFAIQTASFRALLPTYYQFQFVDAEQFCDPSPGAAEYFSGPYRCWYTSPSTAGVSRAHRKVEEIIKDQGPFQIVMGFSQGAALAASLLLQYELDRLPSPFRAAFFICSPLPFSKTTDHGIDSRTYFGIQSTRALTPPRTTTVPPYLIPEDYFLRSDERITNPPPVKSKSASLTTGFALDKQDEWSEGPYYNMFHPSVDQVRISLPTAHLYGAGDPWKRHSIDFAEMCTQKVTLKHGGGHEIPQSASEDICDLIEELAAMAGLV